MSDGTEPPSRLEPLRGSLIPLKTVQETRAVDEVVNAYAVQIGIKSANAAVKLLDSTFAKTSTCSLSHLRRFSKPETLPDYLKDRVSETNGSIFLLIPPPLADIAVLEELLAPYAFKSPPTATTQETNAESTDTHASGESGSQQSLSRSMNILPARIPIRPPTTFSQAQLWSRTLWPTQYNEAAQPATHSPPPAMLSEVKSSLHPHAGWYLALARKVAQEAKSSGRGRSVGVVIVDPAVNLADDEGDQDAVVAVAGDGRYYEPDGQISVGVPPDSKGDTHASTPIDGRPEFHAMLRAIAMVCDKRLSQKSASPFESYVKTQPPLTTLEKQYLSSAPSPSYLCTALDVYISHEPCVMCSMSMLLSRFRSIVFDQPSNRDDASLDPHRGYGLHWRRELNWRAVAFQFVQEEKTTQNSGNEEQFHA